ncbi:hypothetical protein PVAP13_4NG062999 [Panicum virgatum]|uniref:Uncharacterized protein n=1 Tax=Panicum virgatum TaxID=38727 RepID=A0A8T0T5P8_PANVG|nr:hypothetical protein PVAP13_4NG062999 [Panicum virgatum]KAG2606632.1 hypothetical protein PVAP13_4NG062999 [Panicum virgatum]
MLSSLVHLHLRSGRKSRTIKWSNWVESNRPLRKHHTPLSVAKPTLKNQKKRELKKIEEEKLLGIFRKRDKNSKVQKTRPEDRVLKAMEGHFKNGILDVKHLLSAPKSSGKDAPEQKMRKGKHKGKGKQKGGRRKKRRGKHFCNKFCIKIDE